MYSNNRAGCVLVSCAVALLGQLASDPSIATATPVPGFFPIGIGPGYPQTSSATGVSADGSVIVGRTGFRAFRWTSSTGFQLLGNLPGGNSSNEARAVSGDGSVVVGFSPTTNDPYSSQHNQAFRWTPSGGMMGLGFLPGAPDATYSSFAMATSADGSVIVGDSLSSGGDQAFRWTAAEGMVGLGFLTGKNGYSDARGVSADGSVIVGTAGPVGGYRWTAATGMVGLGDVPGAVANSAHAIGVSDDGSTVVGWAQAPGRPVGFRWTPQHGMQSLGDAPAQYYGPMPFATSGDGSVVVGKWTGNTLDDAFIWTESHGMRNLTQFMTGQLGVDLAGWRLIDALDISPDGYIIVGSAVRPDGVTVAYRAVIPEPATILLATGAAFAVLARRRFRSMKSNGN